AAPQQQRPPSARDRGGYDPESAISGKIIARDHRTATGQARLQASPRAARRPASTAQRLRAGDCRRIRGEPTAPPTSRKAAPPPVVIARHPGAASRARAFGLAGRSGDESLFGEVTPPTAPTR